MRAVLEKANEWTIEYFIQSVNFNLRDWFMAEGKENGEEIRKELEQQLIRARHLRDTDPFWFDDDENEYYLKKADYFLAEVNRLLSTY